MIRKLCIVVVIVVCCERKVYSTDADIAKCLRDSNASVLVFDNLPGIGWDNLVNENRGQIIKYTYHKCKTTNDGRYLLPDNVFVVPIKSSKVDIFSEIIDKWTSYTSTTSKSINVNAHGTYAGVSIQGSFSDEYQDVKTHQVQDNSFTVRIGARYVKYSSRLQSDSSLDANFRNRVLIIASHILATRRKTARYESQLLVRDFGTHVVSSINSGAAIYSVEHVNKSLMLKGDISRSQIAASAGVSFFSYGGSISFGDSNAVSSFNKYLSSRTQSSLLAHGGPTFNPINFTLNDWTKNLSNELVAIDRSGDPLDVFIRPSSFPELPDFVTNKVANEIKDAILAYYKFNTIKGCTQFDSPNFHFSANVDDGSCESLGANLTFGGVFQTCNQDNKNVDKCDMLTVNNPKTGAATCPTGYEKVLLYEGNFTVTEYLQQCESYWIFWEKCHHETFDVFVSYSSYWCAYVNAPTDSGYLFGGLYTATSANSVTRDFSCPPRYQSLKIATDISICICDDYESGSTFSVPFGGFFSCQKGNPLANMYFTPDSTDKTCPKGYSQHLATIEDGCEINYCARIKSSGGVESIPLKVPPFIPLPMERHSNNTLIVSNDGQSWAKVFAVPENFSGFQGTDKGWITNDGTPLKVENLFSDHNSAKGGVKGYLQEPEKNSLNAQSSSAQSGLNQQNIDNKQDSKSEGHISNWEIAVVALVSVISTLLCMLCATLVFRKMRATKGYQRA